jgi:cation transporter-like permease
MAAHATVFNEHAVTFRSVDGRVEQIPLAMIHRVSVRNRLRSTVVGGLVLGPPAGVMTWAVTETVGGRDCPLECLKISGIALLTGTIIGATIGYVTGGRTVFVFDQAR